MLYACLPAYVLNLESMAGQTEGSGEEKRLRGRWMVGG